MIFASWVFSKPFGLKRAYGLAARKVEVSAKFLVGDNTNKGQSLGRTAK